SWGAPRSRPRSRRPALPEDPREPLQSGPMKERRTRGPQPSTNAPAGTRVRRADAGDDGRARWVVAAARDAAGVRVLVALAPSLLLSPAGCGTASPMTAVPA